jgi:hypothetical protein
MIVPWHAQHTKESTTPSASLGPTTTTTGAPPLTEPWFKRLANLQQDLQNRKKRIAKE